MWMLHTRDLGAKHTSLGNKRLSVLLKVAITSHDTENQLVACKVHNFLPFS
jgi:hypothetical protein